MNFCAYRQAYKFTYRKSHANCAARRYNLRGSSESIWVARSVADDTMDRKRLTKLRRDLEALRGSQPKAKVLQSLAKKFGRKPVKRGKEPMYESVPFPHLRPLSIPNHK